MKSRVRARLGAVLVAAALGCGTGPDGGRACAQTREFGNYGCADMRGVVLDADGRPAAGAEVSATAAAEGRSLGGTARADIDGRFSFRVRLNGPPLAAGVDTLSARVTAWAAPPLRSASTVVVVQLAAVGAVPPPPATDVALRLAAP